MSKKAILHPKARDAIREFPDEVRRDLGQAIRRLQEGESLGMPLSKPFPAIEAGVSELRIRGDDGIFRTFYLTKSERGILIFHAFMKKTQKTPELQIELGKKRLKELLNG